MFSFKKKEKLDEESCSQRLDGNGRWLKTYAATWSCHKAGMEALQEVTWNCSQGDGCARSWPSLYAFQRKIGRDQKSVLHYNLPVEFYDHYVPELHRNNVKNSNDWHFESDFLKSYFWGPGWRTKLARIRGWFLNFALNYGGRAEINQAVQKLAQDVLDAKVSR